MAKSNEQVMQEFNEAVNMSRKELEEWLQTEESKSVGQSDGGGASKGHKSGRKIVEILEKNRTDYSSDDIDHMRRVVSYVHRHQSQKPEGDVRNSNWRRSLLNWGHDPLK
jgi:Protein of unknown function (DUF3140)